MVKLPAETALNAKRPSGPVSRPAPDGGPPEDKRTTADEMGWPLAASTTRPRMTPDRPVRGALCAVRGAVRGARCVVRGAARGAAEHMRGATPNVAVSTTAMERAVLTVMGHTLPPRPCRAGS